MKRLLPLLPLLPLPIALGTWYGNPVPGDDDFLAAIAAAHRNGHITNAEALDRERTHELILRGRAVEEHG